MKLCNAVALVVALSSLAVAANPYRYDTQPNIDQQKRCTAQAANQRDQAAAKAKNHNAWAKAQNDFEAAKSRMDSSDLRHRNICSSLAR